MRNCKLGLTSFFSFGESKFVFKFPRSLLESFSYKCPGEGDESIKLFESLALDVSQSTRRINLN